MGIEKETLDILKIHQDEYLNSVWKTFAALMLGIGWLISSSETRTFIASLPLLQAGIVAVIVVLGIMHCLTLVDLRLKSAKVFSEDLIEQAQYRALADTIVIKWPQTFGSVLINGVLHLLLITLVLYS